MSTIRYAASALLAVILVVGLTGFVLVAVTMTRNSLDGLTSRYLDLDSPWHMRYEGYFEDHRSSEDVREAFYWSSPTLRTDLAWLRYRVERKVFRLRFDLYEAIALWNYRRSDVLAERDAGSATTGTLIVWAAMFMIVGSIISTCSPTDPADEYQRCIESAHNVQEDTGFDLSKHC